jgi:predicted transcriptional regulator
MVVHNMTSQVNISPLGNDTIQICFEIHKEKWNEIIQIMHQIGFEPTNVTETLNAKAVPWRQAFPEYNDAMIASISLKESRKMAEKTQQQLSQMTGIPQRHISEMENGKRTISKEIAEKFAEALEVDYRIFL